MNQSVCYDLNCIMNWQQLLETDIDNEEIREPGTAKKKVLWSKGNQFCDRCGKRFSTPQCKPTAQPQNPTPEIVPSQPQLEQLQEPTPEVIPAPAKKTPNLPIDELVKWLAEPGDYNRYTPRKVVLHKQILNGLLICREIMKEDIQFTSLKWNPWRYASINYSNKSYLFTIISYYLSNNIKEFLMKKGIQLSTISSQSLSFDYLSFCRSININTLNIIISIGSSLAFNQFLLQQEFYILFMRKLPELKCLDMRSIEHQIFYFPEAKTRFKTLCELKCDTSIDSSYYYGFKNLKYFEWIDDFNDDDLSDPYKDIFLELEKKGDILNHLVLFFQWIEGLDYHYKSMQNLLPKLHKIKTLIINDISFVDETLSKLLVYNDLETLNVSYITVYEASIIIENSGGLLKEVSLKPCRFLMCASNFSEDSLIFTRKIYENCPLIESLSLAFSLSKDHLTELENLLKVCQNLKSLLLIRTNMYEKGSEENLENLLKLLIKSAPNNLRELRFLIKFEFSLKVLEEFLKEWRGRPALSILTSDPIYENEDYKNLINNYKNEGIIKTFKVESIRNIENMNFKIQ
ncbi:hypothetical protein RhiirA4_480634 [Rhizophagus irregularis]|uniref:RNI-like protein n=1 Tax=Rhizophagus irregularis TaxID=588596 RepID=A0A2I1HIC7_9GLOM|nr:hypothetical protein RhiirA4_480634 [Rhizophagus irregularis]